MNKYVAVTDVGSKKIDTYIGNKTQAGVFDIKAAVCVDYDGFMDGEWLNESGLNAAVVDSIKNAQRQAKCAIKKVYVGVSGEFCMVKTKEIEKVFPYAKTITAEEINSLLDYGDDFNGIDGYATIMQTVLYATIDDNRRIHNPEGEFASKIKLFVSYVLCDKNYIKKFDEIYKGIGIDDVVYVSSEYAEALSLFDEEERKKNILFADIGYKTSSVAIARGDSLLDLASFSMGGSAFIYDLMDILKVKQKEAEYILSQVNLNMIVGDDDVYDLNSQEGYPAPIINKIILARIEDFAIMIGKATDKFSFQCPTHMPLFLTGGGFQRVRGAKDKLSSFLGRKVEYIATSIPSFNTPDKSTAVGLIDEAIRTEKNKENFIEKLRFKLGGHKNG